MRPVRMRPASFKIVSRASEWIATSRPERRGVKTKSGTKQKSDRLALPEAGVKRMMMAAWRVILVLTALLAACSATGHGYGYEHVTPGDYDPRTGPGMSLTAHFETGGVRGTICFTQAGPGAPVTITVNLDGLDQYEPQTFQWEITEYPIRFSEYPDFPCADLGQTDLLSDRHGNLDSTGSHTFFDNELSLFGPGSPVGRAVNIFRNNIPVTCANIEYQGISLQTLRAAFDGPSLMGEAIFRRQNGRSGATLHVELFPSCNSSSIVSGNLDWYLRTGKCGDEGPIFGNDTHLDDIHHGAFDNCRPDNPRECPGGDLTTKCGQLEEVDFGVYRHFCLDDQLGLFPLSSVTWTVIVLEQDGEIVGCAPWKPVNQLCARVACTKRPRINMDILFFQYDPGDRTHVRSFITGLDMEKAYLQVRRDPVTSKLNCEAGGLHDKQGPLIAAAFNDEYPTGDSLPVGTLEHKITSPLGSNSLVKQDTTSWLPLFGPFSIIGRSIALVDVNGDTVFCCNIEPVVDPDPTLINSILGYQDETPMSQQEPQ